MKQSIVLVVMSSFSVSYFFSPGTVWMEKINCEAED